MSLFESIKIPIPSLEKQNEIVKEYEQFQQLIDHTKQEIKKSTFLQKKLFNIFS